jgi:large subunit ribosomal protein L28
MPKTCYFCDKGAMAGNTMSRKGLLKKKGGTGSKTTRVNRRRFLPNLQKVRTLIEGRITTINVCTKCIKAKKVTKYVRTAPARS